MPKEVKGYEIRTWPIPNHRKKKHQEADFILENKVKCQKMLASKGIDSEKMWWQVSQSLDGIIKINTSANWKLRIHKVDGDRHVDLSSEILRWRTLLRHTNYLLQHTGSTKGIQFMRWCFEFRHDWHLSERTWSYGYLLSVNERRFCSSWFYPFIGCHS